MGAHGNAGGDGDEGGGLSGGFELKGSFEHAKKLRWRISEMIDERGKRKRLASCVAVHYQGCEGCKLGNMRKLEKQKSCELRRSWRRHLNKTNKNLLCGDLEVLLEGK